MQSGYKKRLERLEESASKTCPICRRIAEMSDEEIDKELVRLDEIINQSARTDRI